MRRGLKLTTAAAQTLVEGFKPIPDEEGTETMNDRLDAAVCIAASNRSPMRRGLKLQDSQAQRVAESSFKPIPDEEGTETDIDADARVIARMLQTDPR